MKTVSSQTNDPSIPPATNGQTSSHKPPRRRRSSASPSTIDQAIALRDALKTALDQSRQLVRALKQHKKHRRIVETTLASLRELEAVA